MMRRVKKTTNEQFDLLKAEMALHPAAARGYGVGAQRAVVDAEWKDIVDKLNALGPPERTMTEWKKVWSDLRLRSIKRLSDEFTPKPKKVKYKSKKNKLLETLNSAESIYASYGDNNEHSSYLSPTNYHDESHNEADESYDNPLEAEEDDLHNTEKHFFNTSHDDGNNSYEVNSLEEKPDDMYQQNNSNSYNNSNERLSPHEAVQVQLSQEKMNYLGQTLTSLEQQMKNQNKIMEHLTKITSNLTELMERHVTGLEKQNTIMERQLKATKCHNLFLRRQEALRRKIRSKCKVSSRGDQKKF